MNSKRLYLDSMVWMYFLEAHPSFGPAARQLFGLLRFQHHRVFATPITVGEILVMPRRNRDLFREAAYKKVFQQDWVHILGDFSGISDTFAEVRAFLKLPAPDSIHLAMAASAQIDLFVTEDKQLLRGQVNGIARICTIADAITILQPPFIP